MEQMALIEKKVVVSTEWVLVVRLSTSGDARIEVSVERLVVRARVEKHVSTDPHQDHPDATVSLV